MKVRRIFASALCIVTITSVTAHIFFVKAGPASTHFELQSYGFGSGGTATSSSGSYSVSGLTGENSGQSAGGGVSLFGGQTNTMQASVPFAPTFVNAGSTYDRLHLTINPGDSTPGMLFAVAISDDNWITTRYIQSDLTIGDTLGPEDFLPLSSWGDTSGTDITGLARLTTYKVRVAAQNESFTQSAFGPEASAATVDPSLSFGVNSVAVTFDPLTGANSHTDSSKQTVLTTSTNGYHGYTIFAHETGPLSSGGHEISDYASPNSTPTTWSGIGFGYTTDDSNLIGGASDRFTAGGPKYAGFTTSAPGDPVAGHVTVVSGTPIVDESHTISYRVTAPESQAAGEYKTTIIYIVVPVY